MENSKEKRVDIRGEPQIILVFDHQKEEVSVVQQDKIKKDNPVLEKISEDAGILETEQNLKTAPSLDINAGFWKNFIKNYKDEIEDPTRFTFLKVPIKRVTHVVNALLVNSGKRIVRKVAEEIKSMNPEIKQIKKIDDMSNTETEKKYRFNPDLVNWKQLETLGLSKEFLEKSGNLENLLWGNKTSMLPLNLQVGSVKITGDCKLSLYGAQDGNTTLRVHCPRKEPKLDRTYFGHTFSAEDIKNLQETGNMGRVATLNFGGKNVEALVGLDKELNELAAVRLESVYISKEFANVKFEQHEIDSLKRGEAIDFEGVSRDGKPFSCTLQYSVTERRLVPTFPNEGKVTKIGGVDLSAEQIASLDEGKAIRVNNIEGKFGQYDSFAKKNEVTGRVEMTSYNPDSPENSREIIIPAAIRGVELTKEDQKTLANDGIIFLKGMLTNDNQEMDRFVKLDPNTGAVRYSMNENFEERQEFKIPQEINGVKLSAKEKAAIQDGKTVRLEIPSPNDKSLKVPVWVKMSDSKDRLNYYHTDPDKNKNVSMTNKEIKKQTETSQKQDEGNKNKQNNKSANTQGAGNKKESNKKKGVTM